MIGATRFWRAGKLRSHVLGESPRTAGSGLPIALSIPSPNIWRILRRGGVVSRNLSRETTRRQVTLLTDTTKSASTEALRPREHVGQVLRGEFHARPTGATGADGAGRAEFPAGTC